MDPEMDHARLISVDPGKKGPSRVPSWPKLGWKFTRTCRCTPISGFFWHIDVYVTFSRGQILLEIHDPIAMRTQTWVGKKCDAFTRVNSVPNSRCHCYGHTHFEWEKFTMLSRVVPGSYRCTLVNISSSLLWSLSLCWVANMQKLLEYIPSDNNSLNLSWPLPCCK